MVKENKTNFLRFHDELFKTAKKESGYRKSYTPMRKLFKGKSEMYFRNLFGGWSWGKSSMRLLCFLWCTLICLFFCVFFPLNWYLSLYHLILFLISWSTPNVCFSCSQLHYNFFDHKTRYSDCVSFPFHPHPQCLTQSQWSIWELALLFTCLWAFL